MGPVNAPPGDILLGYHVTVDEEGYIIKVQPDFDYPKGILGSPWGDEQSPAANGRRPHQAFRFRCTGHSHTERETLMACSICGKNQHSLREGGDCDWAKNHKGKDTDTRKPNKGAK